MPAAPFRFFPALLLALFTLGMAPAFGQEAKKKSFPDKFQEKWEKDGPNVRIKRHQDGSRTVFRRSPDDRTLVKRTFGPNGAEKMIVVYIINPQGNPLSCKIWDGRKNLLYKVSYGYNKSTGRLEAERMFDARAFRRDPKNPSKEMPVRVMYYNYDAQGNPTRPEVYTFQKGLKAEEVFGNQGSFPRDNPFRQER
jgi:hypothetical protein